MPRVLCIFIVLVLGLVANSAGQVCSVAPPIEPQPATSAQPAGADGRIEAVFVGRKDKRRLFALEMAYPLKKDVSGLHHAGSLEVKRHRINRIAALRVPTSIEDCGWIVGS